MINMINITDNQHTTTQNTYNTSININWLVEDDLGDVCVHDVLVAIVVHVLRPFSSVHSEPFRQIWMCFIPCTYIPWLMLQNGDRRILQSGKTGPDSRALKVQSSCWSQDKPWFWELRFSLRTFWVLNVWEQTVALIHHDGACEGYVYIQEAK